MNFKKMLVLSIVLSMLAISVSAFAFACEWEYIRTERYTKQGATSQVYSNGLSVVDSFTNSSQVPVNWTTSYTDLSGSGVEGGIDIWLIDLGYSPYNETSTVKEFSANIGPYRLGMFSTEEQWQLSANHVYAVSFEYCAICDKYNEDESFSFTFHEKDLWTNTLFTESEIFI